MSRLTWILLLVCFAVSFVWAEIQPIDTEPVIKKEQLDFEDDTGVGPGDHLSPIGGTYHIHASPGADIHGNKSGGEMDSSFTHAFIASLCVIVVSELGDKTFFIAAIMAMNHPRVTVFAGAMIALGAMHILSALFGFVITVIPRIYTFYASSALFALFGLKMLREGYQMSPDEAKEEFEEVQSDLRRREDDYQKDPIEDGASGIRIRPQRNKIFGIVSRVFLQALTLTFLAEWGDRSQIATVVMAAREDVNGVIIGGLLGHFLITGLAVVGGRMIATRISIRTVTIIGGIVFLLFALSALVIGP